MQHRHFYRISDSRFASDIEAEIKEQVKATRAALVAFAPFGVKFSISAPHKITFGEPEPGAQIRVMFALHKNNSPSWKAIYRAINDSIPGKAPVYHK